MFNHLRDCLIVFKNRGIILHSRQQHIKVPIAPCSHQHLLLSFHYSSLVDVKLDLTVVFICLSLMSDNVGCLFIFLIMSYEAQSFVFFCFVSFSCFPIYWFYFCCLYVWPHILKSSYLTLMFSTKSFTFSSYS